MNGQDAYAEDYVREGGEWRIKRPELSRLRVDALGRDAAVASEGGTP